MSPSIAKPISIRSLMGVLLIAMSLTLGRGLAWGQGYFGAIVGTVTDPSNAAVPGVSIVITNTQTGVNYRASTNQYGYYTVGQLIPGIYSVTAENKGFQTLVVKPVKVDVNRTITVNMTLKVGAVTQSVQVKAITPLLDTTSGTVGTIVNTHTVIEMPLNGRNFTQLLELTPGSVSTGSLYMAAGGSNYSISGMQGAQNNFTLDGVYDNEEFFQQFSVQPVIDSIQEFKVQTNITSAEFGRAAGANVAVATKSGTNQFHGDAWEFLRNDAFDANSWFSNFNGIPRPGYRHNQFGFTAGGPVYIPHVYNGKGKAFWFADYEGTRFNESDTEVGTIPTTAMLNGDFSAPGLPVIYNPYTTTQVGTTSSGAPIYSRQPFPNNTIPSDMISPIESAYASVFYPATSTAPPNNIARAEPSTLSQYQWNSRVDYNFSNNLRFFGRMTDQHVFQHSPTALPAEFTFFYNTFTNAEASLTWLLNPTTVLDLKSGFNRSNLNQFNDNPAPGVAEFLSQHPMQGIAVRSADYPLYPVMGIAGYSSPGQSGAPFLDNMWQQLANLSMERGRHSLKVGFEWDHLNGYTDNLGIAGIFHFDSVPTAGYASGGAVDPNSGNALASFLLGLPSSGLRNVGQTAAYMRQNTLAGYVQDNVRMTRKLTVDLGLRYEYDGWPVDKFNRLGNYYFDTHSYGWAGVNPITGAPPNAPRSLMNPDYDTIAPRVGLAYSLTPKTVIRSGFGVFYEGNFYWAGQGPRGQWPYAVAEGFSGTNLVSPTQPVVTYMPPYLVPTATSPPNEQHVVARNNQVPFTYQWNIGIQRQLAQNLMLQVTYVGDAGKDMTVFANANDPPPGPGVVGSPEHPRPEQQYAPTLGPVSEMVNESGSNYNAVQVELDKRFSSGIQATVSYAYAHSLGSPGSEGFSYQGSPQNPSCRYCDYGNTALDLPSIFTASWIYALPFGRGMHFAPHMNSVLNAVLGNWELSGIFHYNSGSPFSISVPFDVANTGPRGLVMRPDYIGGLQTATPPPGNATVGYLNPEAFQIPNQYTFGDLGRNTVRIPAFYDLDAGLYKNFPIHEGKQSFQFRSEFFNLPNNHNFGCIGGALTTPGFGHATCTQQSARIIQFGLKFYW